MALTTCKECHAEISDAAEVCPRCGINRSRRILANGGEEILSPLAGVCCKECGVEFLAGCSVCPSCGTNLWEPENEGRLVFGNRTGMGAIGVGGQGKVGGHGKTVYLANQPFAAWKVPSWFAIHLPPGEYGISVTLFEGGAVGTGQRVSLRKGQTLRCTVHYVQRLGGLIRGKLELRPA